MIFAVCTLYIERRGLRACIQTIIFHRGHNGDFKNDMQSSKPCTVNTCDTREGWRLSVFRCASISRTYSGRSVAQLVTVSNSGQKEPPSKYDQPVSSMSPVPPVSPVLENARKGQKSARKHQKFQKNLEHARQIQNFPSLSQHSQMWSALVHPPAFGACF